MFRAFSPRNLPHSYLQSLAVSLPSAGIQNSSCWHFVPQRVQEECVWIHPSLHCCIPPYALISWAWVALSRKPMGISACWFPPLSKPKFFWWCWHAFIVTLLGCLDPAMVQMRLDPKCADTSKALLVQQLKLKGDTFATGMSDQLFEK